METAPLKSFATWARTALIAEVSARLGVVLAPGSSDRVEHADAVAELERAIKAAGGGEAGRAAVAEKVAYTWFNRIIALRFMDANGYTGGVGVVSPERGKSTGQPEVLTDAKRGTFDSDVVRAATVAAVGALLDGTRRSADPQGEAFALLLAEYCRHWHKAMPFMFEREGDYTELLIPSNLLADDSVMARSVGVLTEEVCADVEVIGWLYQFYISERKDEVFAGFKKNKKAGAAEIPAATQLFTPHWIVRYLVENSVGRLWLLNRPESNLIGQMDYYIAPVDEETDFLRIDGPEELTVMDPACGSGHMLTYAFDLLYAIYEEEGYALSEIPGLILEKNLFGVEIDLRAGALAAFVLTMKARARQRTFFSKGVEPNICVLEPISFTDEELDQLVSPGGDRAAEAEFWNQFEHAEAYGSLIQPAQPLAESLERHLEGRAAVTHEDLLSRYLLFRGRRVLRQAKFLSPRYHVVVANPPYMGMSRMGQHLGKWLELNYASTKADMFSSFIERISGLTLPSGYAGMVTPNVWMYIKAHSVIREKLVERLGLMSLVELPLSGFSGATVQLCLFTFKASRSRGGISPFISLLLEGAGDSSMDVAVRGAVGGHRDELVHWRRPESFSRVKGSPIAYRAPEDVLEAFAANYSVGDVSITRKGMATGLNAGFVREWWEVSFCRIGLNFDRRGAADSGCKWFPYANGGEYRKWYGNLTSVVNWEKDGYQLRTETNADGRVRAVNLNLDYVFRRGLSWTSITSGQLSVRLLPEGALFSSASNALFAADDDLWGLLALLNSCVGGELMSYLNPTLNANPGDIGRIPYSPKLNLVAAAVTGIVDLAKADNDSYESSWDFRGSELLRMKPRGSHLESAVENFRVHWAQLAEELLRREQEVNEAVSSALGISPNYPNLELSQVTLMRNAEFAYRRLPSASRIGAWCSDEASDLLSYAVGCMFGRYSLDEPGLILANQGDTLTEYLAKVPNPSFTPDADNVIPIVDGDWFEDDIVARFREFLRVAFGEEHFEENLRFVTESLGVKDIRAYFLKSFYADHVKRYKKRPIYWLFSSPKGSFNALVYMHRYTPSTVSTVLNEYLREYVGKLAASRQHHERLATSGDTPRVRAAAQKEVDRLRKVLLELEEYEHDVLYPLATQQIAIDLDDGVKANYPKFGAALKKIAGLEALE